VSKKKPTPAESGGLSTGCTSLNLACSGDPTWGIPKGVYAFFVGDSSTRKTWIGHTILAEACVNPEFKDHTLVYFDVEYGVRMDVKQYFGKLAERIVYEHPGSLEAFYDRCDEALEESPCVLVLDSMDALVPDAYLEQVRKERKARAGGKEVSGSYGTDKARVNSSRLRVVTNALQKNGSVLVIISQTRQNIGWTAQRNPKTRAGGDALRFYARLEFWLSVRDKVKKRVKGRDRVIGHKIRFKCAKNHVSGREHDHVDVTFYRKTGLDDVGSCIDYLCDEHWSSTAATVQAPEFDFGGPREELARKIEENCWEYDLRVLTAEVWRDIEAESGVTRKRRYE